jgi:hypothetical protein
VAVLKYRLYELNRVISRVVSYALITALLAAVFSGLVLLATHVLPFMTPVAVAAATLVIAALFNPLRRRVQNLVDRRFNRSRYDAEAIVAAFTARLRHTVDPDTVRNDLLGATENAFQPAHVSVWIAPATAEPRTAVAAEAELSQVEVVAGAVQVGVFDATPSLAGGVDVAQVSVQRIPPDTAADREPGPARNRRGDLQPVLERVIRGPQVEDQGPGGSGRPRRDLGHPPRLLLAAGTATPVPGSRR